MSKPTSVALTIYNQNFALVRERRQVDLEAGRSTVLIEDVAALIDPASVHFKSLTAPESVAVREQNYRYDLIQPATLLNKSVGRRVTLWQRLGGGQVRSWEGVIVAPVSQAVARTGEAGGGTSTVYSGMVIRLDDGRLLLDPSGEIVLHEMPPGLIPRPQLAWLVDSAQAGRHEAEISYMTGGVTWKADYVAVVSSDDRQADITGWVTLDNKSGATYENASLQLIAGDVRRLQPPTPRPRAAVVALDAAAAGAPQFTEESFFEYHLYTLEGATTVRENEQKQMTLLSAGQVPAVKKFVYDGRRGFWGIANLEAYRPGESYEAASSRKVGVVMEIRNSQPAMGIPLPKGKMRLYKADSRGGLQFIGEDEIDHTPQDETLRLYVGDTFDAVGEHRRVHFGRISRREVEETFEIALRNHRKEPMTVSVVEHLWADWKIAASSLATADDPARIESAPARPLPFVQKDAHTVEFEVPVPKGGEAKVTYTARTKWL